MMRSLLLLLYTLILPSASAECERLQAVLTYTQEEAPRDLSGLLPVVVERVNQVLEGVVDVQVEWTGGDLHARVGEHIVQTKVTRLASAVGVPEETVETDPHGRKVTTQCFDLPFSILDTNECLLPRGHPMRHACHDSTLCVNTIGSYECVCPRMGQEQSSSTISTANEDFWKALEAETRSPWELSFGLNSLSSCPSSPSTHSCCPAQVYHRGKDGVSCRSSFRCPSDPCTSKAGNDCAPSATCQRRSSPLDQPNYDCPCPTGLMGNGHACRPGIDPKPEPKVRFDGVTPTELTVKNSYYCDCTKPVVDACAGFPPCKGKHQICTVTAGNVPKCDCKPGFMMHETYGCVDEKPPLMRLKNDPSGDQTLRLKQGDVYKEYAVDIQDENAEEYLRSLKIAYSEPLPQGCLTKIGEFHVNYTVATPWTSPPNVQITRRVVIEDIDECSLDVGKYEKTCPELLPRCDFEAGATCVNTIGSYTCQCPKFTTGDGFVSGLSFQPLESPKGFQGGTSCRDTSKPIINLVGPNPKIFRLCKCGGINGVMGKPRKEDSLNAAQQRHYDDDIKFLIESTAGAELCATSSNPSPSAKDCVSAYDQTYKGKVELSDKVSVGELVKKSALRWQVPYNVKDEAGNEAATVWRDIVVEEVDLLDFESKLRADIERGKEAEIRKAVDKAVQKDRKDRESSGASRGRMQSKPCPSCPQCECAGNQQLDAASCEAICEARMESCAIDQESFVIQLLLWFESFCPPAYAPVILVVTLFYFAVTVLRWTLTFMFNPNAYRRPAPYTDWAMTNGSAGTVQDFDGSRFSDTRQGDQPFRSPNGGTPASAGRSPFGSPSHMASPSYGRQQQPAGNGMAPRQDGDSFLGESIYEDETIITPSKSGDGVRKRSGFRSM